MVFMVGLYLKELGTLKGSKSEVQVHSHVCMTRSHCISRCFFWLSFARIRSGGDKVDAESLLSSSWGCPMRDDGGLNHSSGSVMELIGQRFNRPKTHGELIKHQE